jgi:hypothetical protein
MADGRRHENGKKGVQKQSRIHGFLIQARKQLSVSRKIGIGTAGSCHRMHTANAPTETGHFKLRQAYPLEIITAMWLE